MKNNLLGDSLDRAVYVYTPPSYSTGSDRYPVIYFLHGYSGLYRSSGTSTPPAVDIVFSGARAAIAASPKLHPRLR